MGSTEEMRTWAISVLSVLVSDPSPIDERRSAASALVISTTSSLRPAWLIQMMESSVL